MSLSTMIVPKKISVGFQNRSDTYTKKLAYVIYTDAKGVLRKEKSWNSWKSKDIPVEEYDNEPISGFVLNKKVGDYKSSWNHRSAAVRIYDPRGFEFEISVENLLFILQECTSTKGKGLEGEFVYSWEGTELVLLPTVSQEYKDSSNFTSLQTKKIGKADIKEGCIYTNKDNHQVMYLGRFDWTTYDYTTEYSKDSYCGRNYSNYTNIYKVKTAKKHVFVHLDKKNACSYTNDGYWIQDGFTKLATIESTEPSSLFAEAYDTLKMTCKHIGNEFAIKKILYQLNKCNRDNYYSFYFRKDGKNYSVDTKYVDYNANKKEYFIRELTSDMTEYNINNTDLVCTVTHKRNYSYQQTDKSTPIAFEDIEKLIGEKIVFVNKTNDCVLGEI